MLLLPAGVYLPPMEVAGVTAAMAQRATHSGLALGVKAVVG